MVGAVLAAVCCVAPLSATIMPLTGFCAWLTGAGPMVFAPVAAGLVLIAWGFGHRRARASGCETKIRKEYVTS
jgi:mercuric ion transport protein